MCSRSYEKPGWPGYRDLGNRGEILSYEHSCLGGPGRNFLDKIASLSQHSGRNGIILCCLYFHLSICPIRFVMSVEVRKETDSMNISLEIKNRRLHWLGHVLRMPENRIPKVAMRWTPWGRRKRGRPKTTWRRTVMKELEEMGLTWGEAQAKARDRSLWRSVVAVSLCRRRDLEDEWVSLSLELTSYIRQQMTQKHTDSPA